MSEVNLTRRYGAPKGEVICSICKCVVIRTAQNQQLCGNAVCKLERERRRRAKKQHRERQRALGVKELPPLGPPRCEICGDHVKFGSDPLDGRSLVWCPQCGEQPLRNWGAVRRLDQRLELEAELMKSVERGRKPIDYDSYGNPKTGRR